MHSYLLNFPQRAQLPHGLDEPSFKIFCCLWAKVLYFVNVFARHAGLLYITLASGFMERSLSVSCRNCGKPVAHGTGFFSVCFSDWLVQIFLSKCLLFESCSVSLFY